MITNSDNIKAKTFSRSQNVPESITSNSKILKQVNKIEYLGCCKTNQLDSNYDIKAKIEQAKNAFAEMKCDPYINLGLKIGLIKSLVNYAIQSRIMNAQNSNYE